VLNERSELWLNLRTLRISPQDIFVLDQQRVEFTTSKNASLAQDGAPSAAAGSRVSMFQPNSVAIKTLMETGFLAKSRAAAYFRTTW
jgi:hypothetical protein